MHAYIKHAHPVCCNDHGRYYHNYDYYSHGNVMTMISHCENNDYRFDDFTIHDRYCMSQLLSHIDNDHNHCYHHHSDSHYHILIMLSKSSSQF